MALAIVFLLKNAVEAIQICFVTIHLPLCYPALQPMRSWAKTYAQDYSSQTPYPKV